MEKAELLARSAGSASPACCRSELQHAGGAENPAGFSVLELVANLAQAAGCLGVAISGLVDREAAHQTALHHPDRVMALIAGRCRQADEEGTAWMSGSRPPQWPGQSSPASPHDASNP